MRVVIIGGTGHIGTYLTPRLVEAGNHVLCVSRGQKQPYLAHQAWSQVESVTLDRAAEEASPHPPSPARRAPPSPAMRERG